MTTLHQYLEHHSPPPARSIALPLSEFQFQGRRLEDILNANGESVLEEGMMLKEERGE